MARISHPVGIAAGSPTIEREEDPMKARSLLTAVGYAKAPRATLFLKHPVKAASAWVAYRAAKKAAPKRTTTAVAALGAAAAAAAVVPFAVKAARGLTNRAS